MNRRAKKNPNQNSTPPHNPGPSWQTNLDESFWGGNYPNFKQQKWGNDQAWRPGDRGRNSWQKPAEKLYTSNNNQYKEMKNIMQEQNKQLVKGLSTPVECSIAERMMQKMGWQGGGLGVKEEGRTELIEVNLNFINKTTGLGHNDKKQQKKPPPLQKLPNNLKLPIIPVLYSQPVMLDLNKKQAKPTVKKNKKVNEPNLTINNNKPKRHKHETIDLAILNTILDFVMDVKQIEYGFDLQYSKKERRIIHSFVEYLREGSNEEVLFDFDDLHLDKIDEIKEYNNYVLMTESKGAHPNRQLFIYKEAPDEVYLVTRNDLMEDKVDDDGKDVIDKDVTISKVDKAEAVNDNAAKTINKTADLIKDSKSKVVESAPIIEIDEKSIKTANNIVVDSIVTEFKKKIPKNKESKILNDTKINTSDSKGLKKQKIKNKRTVANFIENGIKDKDRETQNLDTTPLTEADIFANNLEEPQIHSNETLQENNLDSTPNNSKEPSKIKHEDIIKIDLTETEDPEITEPATTLNSPKTQETNTKTTEIDTKVNNSENEMDVELAKLRGKPKLEHLEEALYIYIRDFLKHDVYTEMRFLGDFGAEDDEENELLAKLLGDLSYVSDRSKSFDYYKRGGIYKEVYNNDNYYLHHEKDRNGGLVIYKTFRNDPKED